MASRHPKGDGARTTRKQREIQARIDAKDAEGAPPGEPGPVQAGLDRKPGNPLPKQHLQKPGNEHELEVEPRFLQPGYLGSRQLEDMVAMVTRGDSGISPPAAGLLARQGAAAAVLYPDQH